MSDNEKTPDQKVNGAAAAARILNEMSGDNRERILSMISAQSPETFSKINSNIVRFDDIPTISDSGIQVLIGKMSHEDIVLAVATGTMPVKEALLRNMSQRRARAVLGETDYARTVSAREISDMESRFARKIEELRKAGMIRTESEDDVWV